MARGAAAAALLLLAAACGDDASAPPVDAGPPEPFDLFERLSDPYGPARPLPGRYHLASSREPDAPAQVENRDFVVGAAGESLRVFDEMGPGVISRIWTTFRGHATDDFEVGDRVVLALEVDGAEVMRGTLMELTSGDRPALPHPWVAGREASSGGWQLTLPLHFQDRARVTLVAPEALDAYYQIDWRELPDNFVVPAYDGTLLSEQSAHLVGARGLWVDASERGTATTSDTASLAPGGELTVSLGDAGVIRRIEVVAPDLADPGLHATVEVDSETVLDAPLSRWMGTVGPAAAYTSALTGIGPGRAWADHPIAAWADAAVTVRNDRAAAVDVEVVLHHDPGMPPADLGRLRVQCTSLASVEGENFTVLDAADGPGHFVGTTLVMRASMWGWVMLEGDHELYIDGSWQVLGTGVEDYFGGAYYFLEGPFALPTTGVSGWDLNGTTHLLAPNPEVAMYRHHLLDPIPFEETLRFEMETFAAGSEAEGCGFYYLF